MNSNSAKVHGMYVTIIVVLIALMVGGFYYLHKQEATKMAAMQSAATMKPRSGMPPMGGKGMGSMMMTPVTPPAESDQQKQQMTDGMSTATTAKTFNITAGNFYFVPDKITVNKGDKVTFVMTNAGGLHDLVIDELGVKTPMIKTGEAATATFTATKSGSFVYYCDVPGHKARGMWGTLTVQ